MRLDKYLFEKGFAESRQKALGLIERGGCLVNNKPVLKASYEVKDADEIKIVGEAPKYVGRGGLKLEGAIELFKVVVKDKVCIDIGASTGGFTDCLLQHGAKKVIALDSGHGQLHPKLLSNSRVISIEGFNARELDINVTKEKMDIAVMDVSFISQTLLYPNVASVLKEGGLFISLIKPQFEAGREYIKKGGIVKDRGVYKTVIDKVVSTAAKCGLCFIECAESPIKGGDGNTEFISLFRYLPHGVKE